MTSAQILIRTMLRDHLPMLQIPEDENASIIASCAYANGKRVADILDR